MNTSIEQNKDIITLKIEWKLANVSNSVQFGKDIFQLLQHHLPRLTFRQIIKECVIFAFEKLI